MTKQAKRVLVLGGTGKTGRRVAAGLQARGVEVRIGSRAASPAFEWERPEGWAAVLEGVDAVYVCYHPDLTMPQAVARIDAFSRQAVAAGVKRLVLLSGRGEEAAVRCEDVLKASGADWTVVRASWFAQNFDESVMRDPIRQGELALPVGDIGEPFIHADDIAEVVVITLTEDGHVGRTYELTGPRLLTFAQAVAEIDAAVDHSVRYVQLSNEQFAAGLDQAQLPPDLRTMLLELFTQVMDGRNAYLTDDVARLTGHAPRDFSDYVREAAASGTWTAER